MQRLIIGLALLCAPLMAHAQLDYRFTDFVNTQSGFTASFQFRNANAYSDQRLTSLFGVSVTMSDRVRSACPPVAERCDLRGGPVGTFGPVQKSFLVAGPRTYAPTDVMYDDSCVGPCTTRIYRADGFGVLGCPLQAPAVVETVRYVARTCSADGFTGWMSVSLNFIVTGTPLPFALNVTDLVMANAQVRDLGPNLAITSAPEPGTWALMALGLASLPAFRRKRTVA